MANNLITDIQSPSESTVTESVIVKLARKAKLRYLAQGDQDAALICDDIIAEGRMSEVHQAGIIRCRLARAKNNICRAYTDYQL